MMRELEKATTDLLSFQPVKRFVARAESASGDSAPAAESSFETLMKQVLSAASGQEVSEEELFAGLIQERIKNLKGEEALKKYQELLTEERSTRTKADGFVPVEDAAREALRRLVKLEVITTEEGDKIHSQAFDAAQLDDNKKALFDNRGGPGDPTKAVAALEAALLSARQAIDAFGAGSRSAEMRKLDESYDPWAGVDPRARGASAGRSADNGPSRPMDGPQGFLFKPISDSDGKLVVLLPNSLTGDVNGVVLKNRRGRVIEEGMYRGVGNGEREHFRFTRRGEDYPRNITVEVQLKDGSTRNYRIKDPSQRHD